MDSKDTLIAFGPVPSRRLGQSLGINNILPKICSYSCVYCQLGRTPHMRVKRQEFYKPELIVQKVEKKVKETEVRGEPLDYITFVSDGEPTLDIHLGKEIKLLKKLGMRIAVITNASLMNRRDVMDDLMEADWVSVKIDAISSDIWRKINRPCRSLHLEEIHNGITTFSEIFEGILATETMLVHDINDRTAEIEKIADFLLTVKPKKVYLSIPIRPPAERWVKPASEYSLSLAYDLFYERSIDVEYLIGYEGNAFAFTGDVEEDLLSITSVHPMREDAVEQYLLKAQKSWDAVEKLIKEEKLVEVNHSMHKYYMRKFQHQKVHH